MAQFEMTTAARAKAHIKAGGRPLGTKYDTWLGYAITAYSAMVERALNRVVLEESQTEYHNVDGRGEQVYLLRAVPVTTITTVHSDCDRDFADSSLVDSDDYVIEEDSGLLHVTGTTLDGGVKALKVIYSGGMATDAADFATNFPDLAFQIEGQIAYHASRMRSPGKTGHSDSGGSISWEGVLDLLPGLVKAIGRHRMA